MSSAAPTTSRRARLRAQALTEIRDHAYAQIAAGGATALSLNGIAKAMGMTGPAMYRYFAARDELLALLVTESYEDFADAIERAADHASRRTPENRLRAVLDATRAWALDQPHRYRLMFASTYGSGELDPDRVIPAAHRSMEAILRAMRDLRAPAAALPTLDTVLGRQLTAWAASRATDADIDADAQLLALAITAWTRTHGIISIEIEGTFQQMGIDAGRLYHREVDELVARLRPD